MCKNTKYTKKLTSNKLTDAVKKEMQSTQNIRPKPKQTASRL